MPSSAYKSSSLPASSLAAAAADRFASRFSFAFACACSHTVGGSSLLPSARACAFAFVRFSKSGRNVISLSPSSSSSSAARIAFIISPSPPPATFFGGGGAASKGYSSTPSSESSPEEEARYVE